MADDTDGVPTPGIAPRVKGYARRARQVPNAVCELSHHVRALRRDAEEARASSARTGDGVAPFIAGIDELRARLGHLEALLWEARGDAVAGVSAIGDELHRKQHHFDPILDRIDGAIAAHSAALGRAIAAPARQEAATALRDRLGPPPTLRPGLSIFTLCWNHGQLLAGSIRSALEVLDQLPPDEQGQLLVLDDASTDASATVAAELAVGDPRIRVIRAEVNLGLAHARNTLLHVASTSHAFQLDADNTAIASGVLDLYHVARELGSAVTYGNVVQIGPDGVVWGPMSNEPPSAALFTSNYVDTMAVSDVAAYRALGGGPVDPLLEHVDDWAALHAVIEAGLLVAFVPTLVGRYRQLATGFHLSVPDPRIGARRVSRVYDPTGRRQGPDPLDGVAAVAAHPTTGPLWASPAAIALDPKLAPPPTPTPALPSARARILVVGPGGVANVGDDAITVRGLERVRAEWGSNVAVDLVTDGPTPSPGLGPTRWLGPVGPVVRGLRPVDLGSVDELVATTAERHGVGAGRWRPLDPSSYDAAVFLGSGLTSLWGDKTIEPRALLAAALRSARVPYACSGQGYGPIDGNDQRALVGGLVAGAIAVATRDRASAELASGLPGVEARCLTVTGDDALGLTPPDGGIAAPIASEPRAVDGGGRRRLLGVTVRAADYVGGADHPRRWAVAADNVAQRRGWSVLGIALNSQPPEPEISTLAAVRATTRLGAPWRLVDPGPDPRDLVRAVSSVDAMAAQSYHAALFALAAGAPTVLAAGTTYYAAKATGLARRAGLPNDLAVTDAGALARSLDAVMAAWPSTGGPLDTAAADVDAWWAALPAQLAAARATD